MYDLGLRGKGFVDMLALRILGGAFFWWSCKYFLFGVGFRACKTEAACFWEGYMEALRVNGSFPK